MSAAAPANAQSADAQLKQSTEELERLRQRMATMAQSIDVDKSQQDALQEAVEAAEKKVSDAQRQLRKLGSSIEAQNAKVRQAETSRAAAEAKLGRQRELLSRQLRAAYVIGQGGGRAGVLLSQEDPSRVERMLTYYDYLGRARASGMTDIRREIDQVTAQRQQVESALADLRKLQAEHRRAVLELDADRAERAQAMAAVNSRIRDETQEMKRLQGNEKQLQALLDKLRESMREAPSAPPPQRESRKPTPTMRGAHPWPLRGPILARYGEAKAGGKLSWKGLWIGADEGAAVKATAAGRVAYVGRLSSYGLIAVVEHTGGYFTLYGHAATISAKTGDAVDAGEVIGTAGNSGGYEQTGLYFEVRRGTDPQDPSNWLER